MPCSVFVPTSTDSSSSPKTTIPVRDFSQMRSHVCAASRSTNCPSGCRREMRLSGWTPSLWSKELGARANVACVPTVPCTRSQRPPCGSPISISTWNVPIRLALARVRAGLRRLLEQASPCLGQPPTASPPVCPFRRVQDPSRPRTQPYRRGSCRRSVTTFARRLS